MRQKDFNAANAVVEATHRYKEIFYGGGGGGVDGWGFIAVPLLLFLLLKNIFYEEKKGKKKERKKPEGEWYDMHEQNGLTKKVFYFHPP